MRSRVLPVAIAAFVAAPLLLVGAAQKTKHVNPVISLLEQNTPVFGPYAPGNGGGRRGGDVPPRPALELAREALGYHDADFLFNGSMEGGLDRAFQPYVEFVAAMDEAAGAARPPSFGLAHPLVVKTPKIAAAGAHAAENVSRQLNAGAAGIMLVEVESAEEARQGIAAMRFASKGGTRPDGVGTAPKHWGLSEQQYRQKADLWPLNPEGELINWTIVESKDGLARVREIAAVKGIGVLWPGAGTLRGVFSSTNERGERVLDTAAWENAIQTVLAACKEFHLACGFPATPNDIELRMKQGFNVFVMNWGDAGFRAIEIGRKASGRAATDR